MKKLFLLFMLMGAFSLGTSYAQSCNKSKKAGCCMAKASKAASADASIEKRMSDDGKVAFVRKETDATGNAKFVSVRYDEASAKFVNVAPPTAKKKSCTAKKAACSSKAKKGCCSKKGAKKSCGAKKAAATGSSSASAAQ